MRRSTLTIATFLSLGSHVFANDGLKFVNQLAEKAPNAEKVIEKKRGSDAKIYLKIDNVTYETLADLVKNPDKYNISFRKDENVVFNTLVEAIKGKNKRTDLIIEIDLLHRKILSILDGKGKDITKEVLK